MTSPIEAAGLRKAITAELDGPPIGLDTHDAVHDLTVEELDGRGVRSLTSQPPNLEELFLRYSALPSSAEPAGGAAG